MAILLVIRMGRGDRDVRQSFFWDHPGESAGLVFLALVRFF